MSGLMQLLEALGDAGGRGFPAAASTLGRACDGGAWSSCLWQAIAAGHDRNQDKQPADFLESRRRQAFALAGAACEGGDVDACLLRAEVFTNAGQSGEAQAALSRGCHQVLSSSEAANYDALLGHDVCQRARASGAAPPASVAPLAAGVRQLPAAVISAQRLSGRQTVEPSDAVKLELSRAGRTALEATLSYCVGRAGLITDVDLRRSSGAAPYDRALIEAVRGWRYRPLLVQGQPEPVCSQVTLVFKMTPQLTEPKRREPGQGW